MYWMRGMSARSMALENISNIKMDRNGDALGGPLNCKLVRSLQDFRARYNDDEACPGVCGHRNNSSHHVSAGTNNPGVTLMEEEVKEGRHDVKLFELQARERSMCVTMAHGDAKQCTTHRASAPPQPNTVRLRANGFA